MVEGKDRIAQYGKSLAHESTPINESPEDEEKLIWTEVSLAYRGFCERAFARGLMVPQSLSIPTDNPYDPDSESDLDVEGLLMDKMTFEPRVLLAGLVVDGYLVACGTCYMEWENGQPDPKITQYFVATATPQYGAEGVMGNIFKNVVIELNETSMSGNPRKTN